MNSATQKRITIIALWVFWGFLALVIYGELSPGGFDIRIYDKLQHLGAYLALAGLATVALGARRGWIWALVGLVVMGGALEIIQGFVGRDCDIKDEIANTLGVIIGGSTGWAACVLMRAWLAERNPAE